VLDLLKIVVVFALVVGLLRLHWNLGLVMLVAAAVLGVLMGMGPGALALTALRASADGATVSLIVALALIMVLEYILRTTGTLRALVDSLQGLLGDNRVVMGLMPAIIGLLPSAGGARFSAPLVEECANGCVIDPERKSFSTTSSAISGSTSRPSTPASSSQLRSPVFPWAASSDGRPPSR